MKSSAGESNGDGLLLPVQNETLGFKELYMLSLSGRTDKQDAFAMRAAFSNFSYKQVNGVYGENVPRYCLLHVRCMNT
jgi:hypothetical protein